MASVTIRNLDPNVMAALRRRARVEGTSLSALLREVLTRAAGPGLRRELMRAQRPRITALRRRIAEVYGAGTPSERLIREDRDR